MFDTMSITVSPGLDKDGVDYKSKNPECLSWISIFIFNMQYSSDVQVIFFKNKFVLVSTSFVSIVFHFG